MNHKPNIASMMSATKISVFVEICHVPKSDNFDEFTDNVHLF